MSVRTSFPLAETQFKLSGPSNKEKRKEKQQERATTRTAASKRKQELQEKYGKKTARHIIKSSKASPKQRKKAQERTALSEDLESKGIKMTKRGYAKRRQVTGGYGKRHALTASWDAREVGAAQKGDIKTVKRYTKEGVLKKSKKKEVLSTSDSLLKRAGTKRVEKTKYRKGIAKPLKKQSIRRMTSGTNIFSAVTLGGMGVFGGVLGVHAAKPIPATQKSKTKP